MQQPSASNTLQSTKQKTRCNNIEARFSYVVSVKSVIPVSGIQGLFLGQKLHCYIPLDTPIDPFRDQARCKQILC